MKIGRFVSSALLLVFCAALALAQDTGTLSGTVHDSSGAVVPQASVTVTSATTGSDRTTVTNAEGDYLVAGLPAGVYNLRVIAPGFQKFQTSGLILRIAQQARVDVPLIVGDVSTEVTVSG